MFREYGPHEEEIINRRKETDRQANLEAARRNRDTKKTIQELQRDKYLDKKSKAEQHSKLSKEKGLSGQDISHENALVEDTARKYKRTREETLRYAEEVASDPKHYPPETAMEVLHEEAQRMNNELMARPFGGPDNPKRQQLREEGHKLRKYSDEESKKT